jgi:hypothetical protein
MANLTKKELRDRFLTEFLRRLREAPPGTRVYMAAGDLFKDAEARSPDERRRARRANKNDGERGESGR